MSSAPSDQRDLEDWLNYRLESGLQQGKISPIIINRACLVGAGVWAYFS